MYCTEARSDQVQDRGRARGLFIDRSMSTMLRGHRAPSPDRLAALRPSRLIPGPRLMGVLTALLAAGTLAHPAPASAHLRSGTVAVDYRASVSDANTAAYVAQILQSDRALSLTITPGHDVVVLGYLGEPVFRLDRAGLSVNAASPTAAALRLITKPDRTAGPSPRWRLQRGRRSVVWHDARSQGLPSTVTRGEWSVPLLVDGRRARLKGELQRVPAPSPWLWLAVLTGVLAAGLWPLVIGRRDQAGSAAIGCGVTAAAASAVIVVGFALDAYASPGTWIEGLDVLAFIGVGAWGLLAAPPQWHVAAAAALGLIGLAVGLLEGAIYLHSIVLAVLPGGAIRIADIIAIGAGIDAAALSALSYIETNALAHS
jgi:hypothetical protein